MLLHIGWFAVHVVLVARYVLTRPHTVLKVTFMPSFLQDVLVSVLIVSLARYIFWNICRQGCKKNNLKNKLKKIGFIWFKSSFFENIDFLHPTVYWYEVSIHLNKNTKIKFDISLDRLYTENILLLLFLLTHFICMRRFWYVESILMW